MPDEKLNIPSGYESEAAPEDWVSDHPKDDEGKDLLDGIKQLRTVAYQASILKAKRDELMKRLLPLMRRPVTLLDPMTGDPIIAVAQQAKPIKVNAGELRAELMKHYDDEAEVDVIMADVLKAPEVDSKEGGLFQQAVERGQIPLHVVAKVAKENPSSAFIGFPTPQTGRPRQ